MQFKYPELLWALLLLLIPVLVHLFQLRKFKKTAFTNVSLLKKVQAQTRKSRTLKKWLLLFSRMLLFTALIFSFAQPFWASDTALIEKDTVIYIDDSFSMQARSESSDLLQEAIQDLIREFPPDRELSLFTNDHTFEQVTPAGIQNELLGLKHSFRQLDLQEVLLKARSLFHSRPGSTKELWVISDFQQSMYKPTDSFPDTDIHLVHLRPQPLSNISLDSVFISNTTPTQLELKAVISSSGKVENTPISIWNKDQLIAKTAVKFDDNGRSEVDFSLPKNTVIDGKIQLNDTGLAYDNQLYFNINAKSKIKILIVGDISAEFLRRIFQANESDLTLHTPDNLNYTSIDQQDLIVLNQIERIPSSLQNALASFYNDGGSLVVIPGITANLASYNDWLGDRFGTYFTEFIDTEQLITTITFDHPLYKNVFEKSVSNFQYPKVSGYYKTRSRTAAILRYQNGDPFLMGGEGLYLFTAPIDPKNSNFRNSPLIVPSFYNIGTSSLNLPSLQHVLSSSTRIDIPVALQSDEIVKVVKNDYEFIPLQQSFSNRTTLNFEEYPSEDGIFDIVLKDSIVSKISFNYPRTESDLRYADLSNAPVASINEDIPGLIADMQDRNKLQELWQWFIILALLFVLTEVLVQKFIK
ncbi:MAG: BatA domain-containing protein [Flavobacteriaceae bacterium]